MQFIKNRTVAFLGSRNLTTVVNNKNGACNCACGCEMSLREELFLELKRCYEENKINYLCSMTEGWGMMCAEEVLRLRSYYTEVELVAVIPFTKHSARYSARVRAVYEKLLIEADKIIVLSENNSDGLGYDKCNEFLIDSSSEIVVYHNGREGSQVDVAVNLAKWRGVRISNLYRCDK